MSTLSLEDRQQIHDLISRYSFAADELQPEAWADLFTDDGQIITPMNSARGTEELKKWLVEEVGQFAGYQIRHFVTNTLLLPVSADEVRAHTMCLLTRQSLGAGPPQMEAVTTAIYEDEICRTEHGWRFRRRTADMQRPMDPEFLKQPAC